MCVMESYPPTRRLGWTMTALRDELLNRPGGHSRCDAVRALVRQGSIDVARRLVFDRRVIAKFAQALPHFLSRAAPPNDPPARHIADLPRRRPDTPVRCGVHG